MSRVVGVQDKLLHQVTCGVEQDVLEIQKGSFRCVVFALPVCSCAIYSKQLGRNMQRETGSHPDSQKSWLAANSLILVWKVLNAKDKLIF